MLMIKSCQLENKRLQIKLSMGKYDKTYRNPSLLSFKQMRICISCMQESLDVNKKCNNTCSKSKRSHIYKWNLMTCVKMETKLNSN